jgi:hypothetical protein
MPIQLHGDRVTIDGFSVEDRAVAAGLRESSEADMEKSVKRMLSVGAAGISAMRLGLDLAELDQQVRRSFDSAADAAGLRFEGMIDQIGRQLDTGRRDSMLGGALDQLGRYRDDLGRHLDPALPDSHSGRLLASLEGLFADGGTFQRRMESMLSPESGSHLSAALGSLRDELAGLRESLAEDRGRRVESERGTAKGVEFEVAVDSLLRSLAAPIGAIVEHTGRASGEVGGGLVGDHVMELCNGRRLVVESKNVQSLGLNGSGGILAELDRAMANRRAEFAICVSARPAFPAEVGAFNLYGNRLLVVDDGEGTLLSVAVRWAVSTLTEWSANLDRKAVADQLQRLQAFASRFASQRAALTEVIKSVERIRDSFGDMRGELLSLAGDLERELGAQSQGDVIELHPPQAG